MNIGKLYQAKKFYWLLSPSKEIAVEEHFGFRGPLTAAAAAYSKRFNCNVSYISPNSIFVLLEQVAYCCKILTTNGEVGWIVLADHCKNYIEEVNQ
jgi:hypothetical protein